MKKRDLTLERKIGICVLGLLVFLAISCSQDVLAADISTNPVILNVNAVTQVAPALTKGMVNKFTYITSPGGVLQNVLTNWTEKAVFGSVVAAPTTASGTPDTPVSAEMKITVAVKAPTSIMTSGDLIVKIDQMFSDVITTNTTGSAVTTSGGAFTVHTRWFKQDYTGSMVPALLVKKNGESVIDADGDTITLAKGSLSTLTLARFGESEDLGALSTTVANTITLLDLSIKLGTPAQIIVTAVLVDNVNNDNPQVMGVDVKTVFFNYVDPALAERDNYRPIWLDLIQTGGSTANTF